MVYRIIHVKLLVNINTFEMKINVKRAILVMGNQDFMNAFIFVYAMLIIKMW